MVVIADASPLNYLILIGEAHLLPRLFGRVLIPTAVFLELKHPAAPQLVADWMASPPDWLSVHLTPLAAQPPVYLDPGESEALALAQTYLPDVLLLIDEEKGRQEAERRNIPATGTLGVLFDAAAEGLLDLTGAIAKLRGTNFHVSERLLLHLLNLDARRRARLEP